MTVERPRAPLWPILLLVAIGVAVVGAAIAIAGLPLVQPRATPSSSGAATAPSSSPGAATASVPPSAVRDIGPADVGWAAALWVPPPNGVGMPAAFRLQAGTFDDAVPAMDLQVPMVVGGGVEDAGRMPVFGRTPDGVVAFIADDGDGSQLVRATVQAPDATEVVAELAPIVWAMALERDGSHAFLLLLDRDERVDAGVVRVALDGSNDVTEVLPPLAAASAPDVVLAAVSGFRGSLMLARDDAHLLRRVCQDPVLGQCVAHVVDLATNDVLNIPDVEVFALDGGLVYWTRCGQAGCVLGTTNVVTGEERLIEEPAFAGGWSTLVEVDGRTHVAYSVQGNGTSAIVLLDPHTGERRELTGGRDMLEIHSSALDQTLHVLAPPGWIVATRVGAARDARVAIRPSDGMAVELPPVPWRMPQGLPPEG